MDGYGIIYKATSPSGKVYVGQTIQSLSFRIKQHKSSAFNKKRKDYDCHFFRAIRKHGFDNFTWEVIIKNIDTNELNNEERLAVIKFDSFKNGYNSNLGGGSNGGFKHSENARQKIGDAHRGKVLSKSTRDKISKSNTGKIVSQTTREKLSRLRKGKPHNSDKKQVWLIKLNESKKKKYIITKPNGETEIIIGLRAFCRDHGLNHGHMGEVARGSSKQHKKYKCEFYTEE